MSQAQPEAHKRPFPEESSPEEKKRQKKFNFI
jgi:hypothetical protein